MYLCSLSWKNIFEQNIKQSHSAETHHLNFNVHHFDTSRDTSRLIVQLQETELRFDQFYEEHTRELRQCLELRLFEHDFRELQVGSIKNYFKTFLKFFFFSNFQSKFDNNLRILGELTEIGDSVTSMEQLMDELKSFEDLCQPDMERAGEVIAKGQTIIDSHDKCSSRDTVEPKCHELYRITEMFNEKLSKRAEALTKARDLMDRVESANEWCAKGIDLLASQRIENVSVPPETAEIKLLEIIAFIQSAEDFQLSSLRAFEESTPLESIIVSQVSFALTVHCTTSVNRISKQWKIVLSSESPIRQN